MLHSPEGNFHGTQTNYAVNQNEWNKHLRQIFYMIQKEIQRSKTQTYRSENNPIICKRLVMLGASLCSVVSFLFAKTSVCCACLKLDKAVKFKNL